MEQIQRRVLMASAGTGKTYRLSLEYILRIIYEIRKDSSFVDCYKSILAITFTKKATGEISERVFAQLQEIVACDIDDKEQGLVKSLNAILEKNKMIPLTKFDQDKLKLVYQNMCSNKHKIFISTIDGFVNLIFKCCVRSQNNLTNINVVNSHDDSVYYAVCQALFDNEELFTIFKQIYYSDANNLLDAKTTEGYLKIIKSIIKEYFKFIFLEKTHQGEVFIKKDNVDEDALFNDIIKEIDKVIEYVDDNYKEKIKNGEKIYKDDNFKQNYKDNQYLLNQFDLFDNPIGFVDGRKVQFRGGKKAIKENFDKNIKIALLSYEIYRDGGAIDNHNKYCKFVNQIFDIYNDIIFSIKEFDFNDVAIQVFKSFYDNDTLCKASGDYRVVTDKFWTLMPTEFKHCLIDEAQDTSVLQWKILEPLLRNVEDFTIVGDEKQAIYGWRGGETSLLASIANRQDISGKVVEGIFPDAQIENLDTCYRSSKNVIKCVNEVFSNLSDSSINVNLHFNKWNYTNVNHKSDAAEGSFHIYFDKITMKESNKSNKDDAEESDEDDDVSQLDENYITEQEIKNKTKNQSVNYFINNVVLKTINENNIALKDVAILARKNDLLNDFASILKEKGIAYYLDSSKPFFTNVAVSCIINLLKYIVYDDNLSLFEFLKSPLINVDNQIYKKLLLEYRDNKSLNKLVGNQNYPYLEIIENLKKDKGLYNGVYSFIKRVFEDFSVTKAFGTNVDCKNLYKLLELALKFDNEMVDYNKSLSGFLLYCQEHEDDESLASLTGVDAINLLTTHKSKGLEYPYVFVYNYVSDQGGNDESKIAVISKYDDKYTKFDSFLVVKSKTKTNINKCNHLNPEDSSKLLFDAYASSRNDDLIEGCFASLVKKSEDEFFEKLNTLYVAITRPKYHLFLYNVVSNSFDSSENMSKLNSNHIAAEIFNYYFGDTPKSLFYEKNEGQIERQNQTKVEEETKIETKFDNLQSVCAYFDYDIQNNFNPQGYTKIDIEKLSKEYQERKRLTGIVVHDYLSKIRYANEDEMLVAKQYIYTKYGNIFSKEQFDNIFNKTDSFISQHSDIFSKNWTRVYNEYALYDKKQLVRLDRLLINDNTKEIKIVDYKTGKYEEQQIENYISIIKSLGFSDWNITGDFLSFEV